MTRILNKIQAQRLIESMAYMNDLSVIETVVRLLGDNGQCVQVEFYGNHVTVRQGLKEREFYTTQADFAFAYGLS